MNTTRDEKEDKAMANTKDARRAHELLDELDARAELSQEQEKLLRSFLPERPKQKTLEEICEDVALSLDKTSGDQWGDESVYLESWLKELHAQLKGLKDTPVAVPALPAGMRLADHEEYGRCVVSPTTDEDGERRIFYLSASTDAGADCRWVPVVHLSFIDTEPAESAHPEFLETEADYAEAPRGTVAAKDGWNAWLKETDGVWSCGGGSDEESRLAQTGKRRVLRWGWKNERPR